MLIGFSFYSAFVATSTSAVLGPSSPVSWPWLQPVAVAWRAVLEQARWDAWPKHSPCFLWLQSRVLLNQQWRPFFPCYIKQGSRSVLQRVPQQQGWCQGWVCWHLASCTAEPGDRAPAICMEKLCCYQVGSRGLLGQVCSSFTVSRSWAVVPHQGQLLGAGLGRGFASLSYSNSMFGV